MDKIHKMIAKKFHLSNRTMMNLPYCSGQRYNRDHLAELFFDLGYKTGAEIGVRRGRFSEIICKANPEVELYCIDPWARIGNKYSPEKQEGFLTYAKKRLKNYNVHFIRKTSMASLYEIEDGVLDFIFIDGDHHFDFVMVDIIFWAHKVRRGGIMAVHDCYHGETGVVKAVEAYTHAHDIRPWYVTKELSPTAYWVNP